MGVWYSNGSQATWWTIWFQTFWTINRLFSVQFSDHHSNTGPFDNWTQIYHLNTRQVRYSDGYWYSNIPKSLPLLPALMTAGWLSDKSCITTTVRSQNHYPFFQLRWLQGDELQEERTAGSDAGHGTIHFRFHLMCCLFQQLYKFLQLNRQGWSRSAGANPIKKFTP